MTRVQRISASDVLTPIAKWSLALAIGIFPWQLVVAQQPQAAGSEQAAAQKAPDRLPGKIYVEALYERRAESGEIEKNIKGVLAIDPNSGEFQDLGDLGGSIRVSPDGKRYAAMNPGVPVDGENTWDLHVMGATQLETLHFVENANRPAWSGDGNQVVYNVGKMDAGVGWRGKASIVDLTTMKIRELSIPETDEVDDWSAEGDWLVTVSDRHPQLGSGYQLYAMHSDGSAERRLTEGPGINCYPRFRPGSNQVVYDHQNRDVGSLRVVDIDGKNCRDLIKSEDGRGQPDGACWSPDGKWLAVVKFDWSTDANGKKFLLPGPAANYRLEIIAPDGASRKVVAPVNVTGVLWLGHPDWR